MSEVRYEKPSMKYVSLRNESNVANTCWGFHGSDTKLYCDIDGPGWTSFQIAAGPCALNLINVYYYTDTNGNGKADENDQGTLIVSGDDKYNSLYKKLEESGGNNGTPYKGEGTIVIPDNPEGSWS